MAEIFGTNAGERLRGTGGGDDIFGNGGNDNIRGRAGDDFIEGNAGNDTLAGNGGSDTLLGGSGNDELDGGGGRDSLRGGRGNDDLIGSRGNDTLNGGNGIDTANYADLGRVITLQAVGLVNKAGAGTDQLENVEVIVGATGENNVIDGTVSGGATSAFDIDLSAESLTVTGIPRLGDVNFTVENFVNVIGTSNTDTIVGDSNDNVFSGSEGNDTLDGGDGDDTADYSGLGQAITLERAGAINKGSAGTDNILNLETIIGAEGEENAIDGSTGISGTTSFDIDLSQETLTVNNIPQLGSQTFEIINFVNATGTSNDDDIVGNDSDNVFGGSEGDDSFDGQGGDDTVDYSDLGRAITLEGSGVINKGRAGEDNILEIETIIGAEGRDNAIDGSTGISGQTSFVANLAEETFTVRNVPGLGNLNFNVVNFVDITGTSRADNLVGDREDNEFRGENGNDTLVGGAGDDRIFGGTGRDRLIGVDPTSANPGAGEVDIIDGGGARDTIVLGDGSNVFYSFAGSSDFADIRGFQTGRDTIELTGSIGDYFFNSNNTAIFSNANNDLIAEFTNGAFAESDLSFV